MNFNTKLIRFVSRRYKYTLNIDIGKFYDIKYLNYVHSNFFYSIFKNINKS